MPRTLDSAGLLAVFWLIGRVALGWHWLDAGLDKAGESAWTGANAGVAVTGYLNGAIESAHAQAPHPEVGHWFATLASDVFLPQAELFGWLVVVGEIAVGIALLAGFLTKPAVVVGLVMNFAFLLAGTSSTNPYMLVVAAGLLLAVAPGRIGADAFVMPVLARMTARLREDARWRRWTPVALAGSAVLALGFLTYVMLEDDVTFAAVWAAALPAGALWLWAEHRARGDQPPAGRAESSGAGGR